jgi:hypothetical protein
MRRTAYKIGYRVYNDSRQMVDAIAEGDDTGNEDLGLITLLMEQGFVDGNELLAALLPREFSLVELPAVPPHLV